MISSFSFLNPADFSVLSPELTVFLFPVGGLEQHGPHLPFGTKLLQAEEKTQLIANHLQQKMPQWSFVLMPLLPLTVDTITSKIALSVRPHVVRDAIVDQCEGLKRLGFMHFAVVSSHLTPRQLSALEDAARIVGRRKFFWFGEKANLISVSSARVQASEVWKSPMIAIPIEHGGADDTATLLRANRKLVAADFEQLSDLTRPEPSMSRFVSYFRRNLDGYWGKPKLANVEVNLHALNREAEEVALQMQPVFEKYQGKSFFNSGYRYFPLNGSFFKAYLLAAIFFVVMIVWVMWSMKDLFDVS
jgi:creatinine amidohydrolase/Fe(II)-dependent formamide hydrolase-like protein